MLNKWQDISHTKSILMAPGGVVLDEIHKQFGGKWIIMSNKKSYSSRDWAKDAADKIHK